MFDKGSFAADNNWVGKCLFGNQSNLSKTSNGCASAEVLIKDDKVSFFPKHVACLQARHRHNLESAGNWVTCKSLSVSMFAVHIAKSSTSSKLPTDPGFFEGNKNTPRSWHTLWSKLADVRNRKSVSPRNMARMSTK